MTKEELIKKLQWKYRAKKYKIWKWNKTVIIHDSETGKRRSLNKEIRIETKKSKMPSKAFVPDKEVKRKTYDRKTLSLRWTHIFICDCIVKNSEKYKREKLPREVTHHYAYETDKGKPRYSIAKKKHGNDYPDHELLTIKFHSTKRPSV